MESWMKEESSSRIRNFDMLATCSVNIFISCSTWEKRAVLEPPLDVCLWLWNPPDEVENWDECLRGEQVVY